mmetsp:Transcript_36572/g.57124  ORF Transcript_36572/g.57124 Transcript_36572/m.57124 type:complete len:84 (+) Transcript_36572:148-399(+)
MRSWITNSSIPGFAEWERHLRRGEGATVRCRLCRFMSKMQGFSAEASDLRPDDEMLSEVRRVQKEEHRQRQAMSVPQKVKVEL